MFYSLILNAYHARLNLPVARSCCRHSLKVSRMLGPSQIIAILAVLAKERLTLNFHLLSFFWCARTTYQQRENTACSYLATI